MAKKEYKSRKSQQGPVAQTHFIGPEIENRSSPVCYANAPELRPEFLEEEEGPPIKSVVRLERAKLKSK